METKKQRIIRWLTLFLLIINVSAFTTILFLNKQDNVITGSSSVYSSDGYLKSDEFIKQQLKLDEEQYKKVGELDSKVLRSYQIILDLQCEANFEILDELSSPNPSISKLDSLAYRVGRLNGALKRQTIRHFLNIRSLCNPEQKTRLQKLLQEMLEVDKECTYCNKKECSRRDRILKK